MVYVVLVFEMLRLWLSPDAMQIDRLNTLAVMMGFEFIMIHSGVFMSVMPRKISLFFLIPFYSTFAFAMNTMVSGNTILWLYFGVVLLRMRFAFSNPSPHQKQRAILVSICAALLYFLLLVFMVLIADLIPKFGLTNTFLNESGYRDSLKSGGVFLDMPHVPMAMGVIYFTLIAFMEAKFYGLLKFHNKKSI